MRDKLEPCCLDEALQKAIEPDSDNSTFEYASLHDNLIELNCVAQGKVVSFQILPGTRLGFSYLELNLNSFVVAKRPVFTRASFIMNSLSAKDISGLQRN